MKRHYRLYELEDTDFEDLVCRICMQILGMGTLGFAAGPDGGRDARFRGTAQNFPSNASPAAGQFIVQAKHTQQPGASCSHSSFTRIFESELPKVEKLVLNGELEHYILFTNRGVTAEVEAKLTRKLNSIKGIKSAWVLGDDPIRQRLDAHPHIWTSMGFDRFETPFRISPQELNEVVVAFHKMIGSGHNPYDSALNFDFVEKEKKNEINGLTKSYYEYMQRDSVPYFYKIKNFLENPTNNDIKDLYHDAADELKAKIIINRKNFETFDEVLTALRDKITTGNPTLHGKKRLVSVFLHYMYFDCDIGDHAPSVKAS